MTAKLTFAERSEGLKKLCYGLEVYYGICRRWLGLFVQVFCILDILNRSNEVSRFAYTYVDCEFHRLFVYRCFRCVVCQATFGTLEIVFGQWVLRRLHYLFNIFGRVLGVFALRKLRHGVNLYGIVFVHLSYGDSLRHVCDEIYSLREAT